MNEQTKTTMMTEGSVVKNILFFSVRLMVGKLIQKLYKTFSNIMISIPLFLT